ncbi:MAG: hypothetical protein M0R16_02815 [Bacteroidales bacterium]|jgi:hypothetical protein|nr:hypothetical protein [Bacteroidales bacterium]
MKKIGIISLVAVVIFIASCTTVSNVANSDAGATATGTACGKVLASMYSQYKSTGKIDMGSTTTISNIVQLGTYVAALKNNRNSTTYKQAFAAGLVTGSTGLVTTGNSTAVMNALLNLTGLSGYSSTVASTSTQAINIASGLVNLFQLFK